MDLVSQIRILLKYVAHKKLKGDCAGVIKFCTNKIPDEWKIDGIKTGPNCDTVLELIPSEKSHIIFCILCRT